MPYTGSVIGGAQGDYAFLFDASSDGSVIAVSDDAGVAYIAGGTRHTPPPPPGFSGYFNNVRRMSRDGSVAALTAYKEPGKWGVNAAVVYEIGGGVTVLIESDDPETLTGSYNVVGMSRDGNHVVVRNPGNNPPPGFNNLLGFGGSSYTTEWQNAVANGNNIGVNNAGHLLMTVDDGAVSRFTVFDGDSWTVGALTGLEDSALVFAADETFSRAVVVGAETYVVDVATGSQVATLASGGSTAYPAYMTADGATVVGQLDIGADWHVFIWTESRGVELLPAPTGTSFVNGSAYACNEAGSIVYGYMSDAGDLVARPVMWVFDAGFWTGNINCTEVAG